MRLNESIENSQNQQIYRKEMDQMTYDMVDMKKFKDYDKVIGPDNKVYYPKDIVRITEQCISNVKKFVEYSVSEYLDNTPIIYTFIVKTMATDGTRIFINPQFFMWLQSVAPMQGVTFVLLHETYHNLFRHIERENADPSHFTDHTKANYAQDAEINWVIENGTFYEDALRDENNKVKRDASGRIERGLMSPFKGLTKKLNGIYYDEFANMLFEEIYDLLPNDAGKDDKGSPLDNNQQQNNQSGTSGETGDNVQNSQDGFGSNSSDNSQEMSDDYKNGYRDGYNATVQKLIEQGILLPESENICLSFGVSMIFEAAGVGTYDEGYKAGEEAVMQAIEAMKGNSEGQQGGQPISISDLQKIISNFPVAKPQGGQGSQGQQDSQADQQKQQGSQQTDGDSGQQENNNDGQEKITDGGWSEDSMSLSDEHTISEEVARKILKSSGYDDEEIRDQRDPYKDKEKVRRDLGRILKDAAEKSKQKAIQDKNRQTGGDHSALVDNKEILTTLQKKLDDKLVEIFTPAVDWKEEIKMNVKGKIEELKKSSYIKKRVAYGRPGRNIDPEKKRSDRVIVFIDTSGSVWSFRNKKSNSSNEFSDTDYMRIVTSELINMAEELQLHYIDLFYFHTHVYLHHEIDLTEDFNVDTLRMPDAESGGTSYNTIFDVVDKGFHIGKDDEYDMPTSSFCSCIIFTDEALLGAKYQIPDDLDWGDKLLYVMLVEDPTLRSNVDDMSHLSKKVVDLPYSSPILIDIHSFYKSLDRIGFEQEEIKKDMNESLSDKYTRKVMNTLKMGKRYNKKYLYESIWDDLDTDIENPEELEDDIDQEEEAQRDVAKVMPKFTLEEVKKWMKTYLPRVKEEEWTFNSNGEIECVPQSLDTLVFDDKALQNWNNMIYFSKVVGNVSARASLIKEFPKGFPRVVEGNFSCLMLKQLTSLKNGPVAVLGDYTIRGSRNMDTLQYAPKRVDGYFWTDNFSDDDYRALTDKAVSPRKIVKAPQSKLTDYDTPYKGRRMPLPESKKFKFIKERVAARKKHINEDFKVPEQRPGEPKRINRLSLLFKNPLNRDAARAIKDIPVMWSEIDDSQINFYPTIQKGLAGRRSLEGKNTYGINIFCSPASDIRGSKINIISTGNNMKEWAGRNTWLYVDDDCFNAIQERAKMVQDIQRTGDEDLKQELDELVHMVRSNEHIYEVKDVVKAGVPRSKTDLVYAQLKLVPDYVGHAYHVVGNYNNQYFSFARSRDERNKIGSERAVLNRGTEIGYTGGKYKSRSVNPASPQMRKYMLQYVNPEIVKETNQGRMSIGLLRRNIQIMKEDIETMSEDVRQALFDYRSEKTISGRDFDRLYREFADVGDLIDSFNNTADNVSASWKRRGIDFPRRNYKDEVSKEYAADFNMPSRWSSYNSSLVKEYLNIIKSLAEIMSKTNTVVQENK